MDHTEFLNALASVCEYAQRMPVCETTGDDQRDFAFNNAAMSPADALAASSDCHYSTSTVGDSTFYQSCSSACGTIFPQTPTAYPTPPQPPRDDDDSDHDASAESAVHQLTTEVVNPLLQNVIAYAQFTQYLDETWPEKCQRRGSAVIRASLYAEIADSLRGGFCSSRFRYWVKKCGFFLIERLQSDGTCAACLAIPTAADKKNKDGYQEHRLVARLEDFIFIIGLYHNDERGHAGIRKTYSLIQREFSYLPRTAVAKFIELCDTCSYRLLRHKGTKAAEIGESRRYHRHCTTKKMHEQVAMEVVEETETEMETETNTGAETETDAQMLLEPQIVTCTEETSPMVSSSLLLYGNEATSSLQDVVEGMSWEELMAVYEEIITSSQYSHHAV